MPATYEPIATATVTGSATSSLTLSSIAGTYTDLRLVCWLQDTTYSGVLLKVNGSSTTYSRTLLSGTIFDTATSGRDTNMTNLFLNCSQSSNEFATATVDLMSYANTSVFKTFLAAEATLASTVRRYVGLWRNTSAITSISIESLGAVNSIAVGTSLSLYGIKAA